MPAENEVFTHPEQMFTPAAARKGQAGFFLHMSRFSPEAEAFLQRYCGAAKGCGLILEAGLPNPDPGQISLCRQTLGEACPPDAAAAESALRRWIPTLSPEQAQRLAGALWALLTDLRQRGKTEGILASSYIQAMCWLRFSLAGIASQLGGRELPKLLFAGRIGRPALQILGVLCRAGCDILLLQTTGEPLPADPAAPIVHYDFSNGRDFPAGFSVKTLCVAAAPAPAPAAPAPQAAAPTMHVRLKGRETPAAAPVLQLPGMPVNAPAPPPPAASRYAVPVPQEAPVETNTWMTRPSMQSVLVPPAERGKGLLNCFLQQQGAPDRLTFQSDLLSLRRKLEAAGRKLLLIEGEIPQPLPAEVAEIRRRPYQSAEDAILDLSRNLTQGYAIDLQPALVKAFTDLMTGHVRQEQLNVNKTVSVGVCLLCWLRRCQPELLSGRRKDEISCLIFFGPCKTSREALFLRLMASLPVDVLNIVPQKENPGALEDERLRVLHGADSVPLDSFPRGGEPIRMATTAYLAERDLDHVLYSDTGLYRAHQFSRTDTVTLQTSLDEIAQLWDKELRDRPSFSANGEVVSLPVLFAQVNGVPKKNVDAYWSTIKGLLTPNAVLVPGLPQRVLSVPQPAFRTGPQYIRAGVLQRDAIREARGYPFALLRNEIQEYLLDKIQALLDMKLIAGTFQNGTEYAILTAVFSVNTQLVRLIQQFDFTKRNPKVVVVHTGEERATREDAILFAFLNLIGFDVVFYVPTGYQCVEHWYTQPRLVQHQAGDYLYDLTVPDFDTIPLRGGILRNLFNWKN